MSAYRKISESEARRLSALGYEVEWAEGIGHIVYDQQALEEFQKSCEEIKKERAILNNCPSI